MKCNWWLHLVTLEFVALKIWSPVNVAGAEKFHIA